MIGVDADDEESGKVKVVEDVSLFPSPNAVFAFA